MEEIQKNIGLETTLKHITRAQKQISSSQRIFFDNLYWAAYSDEGQQPNYSWFVQLASDYMKTIEGHTLAQRQRLDGLLPETNSNKEIPLEAKARRLSLLNYLKERPNQLVTVREIMEYAYGLIGPFTKTNIGCVYRDIFVLRHKSDSHNSIITVYKTRATNGRSAVGYKYNPSRKRYMTDT